MSDRASQGVYSDDSGPAILDFFREAVQSPWEVLYRLVPDEQPEIEAVLKQLVRPAWHAPVHCPGNVLLSISAPPRARHGRGSVRALTARTCAGG